MLACVALAGADNCSACIAARRDGVAVGDSRQRFEIRPNGDLPEAVLRRLHGKAVLYGYTRES